MNSTAPNLESWPHVFEPGDDAGAPPILVLHGTGGNEHDLMPLAQQLSPGSALFSPRGAVLENGMPRYFERYSDGSFNDEDLAARTDELAALVGQAADHYGFERSRLIALGFSNGANIAVSLLLRQPDTLAGAVLLRAMAPATSEVPDLTGRRIFIASGANDPWAPPDQVEHLVQLLRIGGADVEHVAVGIGHNLTQQDLTAAQAWFAGIVDSR